MFRQLQNLFIPHRHNRFRPRFFRVRTVVLVLLLAVSIEAASFALPAYFEKKGLYTAEVLQGAIASLSNAEREKAGLSELIEDPLLNEAATLKAQDMAKNGYFAHTSPAGVTPWHWFNEVGYEYEYAGENLALHFTESEAVVAGWVGSPTHYENIIKKQYTHMGTGIAKGMYDGVESVFVVQVYARPLAIAVPVEKEVAAAVITEKVEEKEEIRQPEQERVSAAGSELAALEQGEDGVVLGAAESPLVGNAYFSSPQEIWNWLIASPHKIAYMLLVGLLALAGIAYLLAIVIHIRIQHRSVLKNGALLLVALAVLVGLQVWASSVAAPYQTSFIASEE